MQMSSIRADRIGIIASSVCALHCALTPFLGLGVLGAMFGGSGADLSHDWHIAIVSATLLFALLSMMIGQWRHQRYWALIPMISAIALFAGSLLFHEFFDLHPIAHAVLYTSIGTMVLCVHFLNIKLAHGHVHDSCCPNNHYKPFG